MFTKKIGLKFDDKKAKEELTKLAIIDYFFAQTDRHRDNIEFLINANEIKFAPVFDNGFCFNLWRRKYKDEIIASEHRLKKGDPQFLKIHNMEFHKGSGIADLAKQIITETKEDEKINNFVKKIYSLDIDKILNEVYAESSKDFSEDYLQNCKVVFDYRKHLYLTYQKSMLFQEKVENILNDTCKSTGDTKPANKPIAQERFF